MPNTGDFLDSSRTVLDRFKPFPKSPPAQAPLFTPRAKRFKLTEEKVQEIREKYGKIPSGIIAKDYGICISYVRYLNRDKPAAHFKDYRNAPSKLTPKQVRAIRSQAGKVSTRQLAKDYGVSAGHISRIQNGHKRKGIT